MLWQLNLQLRLEESLVTVAKTIKKPAYDGFSGGKAKA